jgi:CO/xanthine dehydrogenase Mo-binding subunit
MDMIAERLGMDPVEFRRKNLVHDGDTFTTGQVMANLHYDELLDDAVRAVGWDASPSPSPARGGEQGPTPSPTLHPQGGESSSLSLWERTGGEGGPASAIAEPVDLQATALTPTLSQREREPGRKRRGRAVVCTIKSTVTPSTSSALAKLNEDGSLNVLTSSVEMGQGAKTTLAQIAAHYGDVPLHLVRVSEPDTDVTPYDQQTSSSRTTFSMGEAVKLAVREIKQELCDLAAGQLEVAPEDLQTEEGRVFVRGAPSRGLGYDQVVARSRRGNLLGRGTFATEGGLDADTGQGIATACWLQAAAACEVEVDTETGKVEVLKFHANTFTGRMVNPRQCELQIEGSTAFGVGQALFEEMVYEDGRLQNGNLADYTIPSFEDLPRDLTSFVLEAPGSEELYGIGETTLPPVMPAIANAVYNAVGVRITDLPITPEKVLRALQEQRRAPHPV